MISFGQKSARFIRTHPSQDAFFTVLEGAVRSGKTWAMIPKITGVKPYTDPATGGFVKGAIGLNDYDVEGDRVFFGVSKETIFNNVLNELFNQVGTKNYTYNRQSGELWLRTLRNKWRRWSVVGAKDEGSEKYIRGRTVGLAYGDELTLIPKSFLDMMTSRMSPDGARLYGTTNPDSPYHYLYLEWLTDNDKLLQNMIKRIHYELRDNLSLSSKKIAQYEAMYKGVFYQRMILGMWVIAEGAIYKDCFDDANLYDNANRPTTLFNAGGWQEMFIPIDYGTTNPTVFLHVIDDGTTYWCDDEYYYDSNATGIQKTDSQYVKDLIEWQKLHGATGAQIIVDPSAASLKAELVMQGIWNTDNADNEVIDGIRNVSTLLLKKKIRIHERCKKLRAELASYAWDKKKQKIGEDAPIKQNDHAPDALRYFVQTKVPKWRLAA
jgi:PBSX family phage terminase large subunit